MGSLATWQLAAAALVLGWPAQAAKPDAAPAPRTIALERLWTIGGESEAEGEVFGIILDLAVDREGRVYLLDTRLSELRVFSPDGEYLRTIGREGEGPGDLFRPQRVAAMPDGSLCVTQFSPPRCSRFSPDGEYLGELALADSLDRGERTVFVVAGVGEQRVVETIDLIRTERYNESSSMIRRIDAGGRESSRIAASTPRRFVYGERRFRELGNMPFRWSLAPNGVVYLVKDFGDDIEVWGPEGALRRVVDCGYAHRMRSDEELATRRSAFGSGPQALQPELMDYDPDIQWLSAAQDGRLWVMSSQGRDAGGAESLGIFDVFGPDGRLEERIQLRGAGRLPEDRFFLQGDRLFVLSGRAAVLRDRPAGARNADGAAESPSDEEDDDLPPGVVCYRVPGEAFR
ncbi:hypothetical protein FJ251_08330 [bacterium]|nr:hypothetical protein [bacterium]